MKNGVSVAGLVIGLLLFAMWFGLFTFASARDHKGINRGEYQETDIPDAEKVLYDYEPEKVPYVYADYCEKEFAQNGECILPEEEDLTP